MADFFLVELAAGILFFLLLGTFILKKAFKAQSFVIASVIKSTGIVKVFDRFLFLGKLLDIFAELGLILGFGLLAFDFNHARKKRFWKRTVLDILAFAVLAAFFYLLFGNAISMNPQTKGLGEFFSVVFAFSGLAGFVLLSLALNAVDILVKISLGKKACPGVAPLIPGVQIPGIPFFVPIHGWISLLIILLVHEGFHGIVARRQGFKVKSAGLLFLGLLPIGAFVDPDEKQLKKAEPVKSLRVFSAGPAANLFSILAFILIGVILFNVLLAPQIAEIASVKNSAVEKVFVSKVSDKVEFCGSIYESNASGVLDENMQVLAINGKKTGSLYDALLVLSQNKFKEISLAVLDKAGNAEEINIKPNEIGVYGFTLEEKIKAGFVFPAGYEWKAAAVYFLQDFFNWLIILSLLVGMVNFIPMNPFDGGRIAVILLSPYFAFLKMNKEDTERFVGRLFLWLVLGLLILNALPLFV